jgi:dephospho-CoA kinase
MLSFKQYLSEGVNDPAIFKVVFMAGGPGSGKSFVSGKTGISSLGLKFINSDPAFEAALKKANLSPSSADDVMSPKGQEIRNRVKGTIGKQLNLATSGRLGLIIDGTGKDYAKIAKQKEELEKLGYECKMLFVNTSKETALERNNKRSRKLPEKEVVDMWSDVQKNIGKFQNLFGGEHMIVVDNDKEVDIEKVTTSTYKKIAKWVKEPPKNVNAKKWIAAASKKHADDPGKYLHGKGKSHKGGEYKNPETDDHYSDFKG